MRVAFLVDELGRSGGMTVIRAHARHLVEHESIDCQFVVCSPRAAVSSSADSGIPVRRIADMIETPVDVAIATWWTTTESLWDLPAGARAVLMQSTEQRYYRDDEHPDRLGAEAVFELPVHWLVVSEPLRRLLAEMRPDAKPWLVTPGIDKSVFKPNSAPRPSGPLRVLIEGQPSMWFKGVADGIAAVRRMTEAATVTVVRPDVSESGPVGADRVVGGLAPSGMAALYAEHDVLLKLSRFEGLGLPVLEGFHTGLPCIVTPFGGAAELVEHGVNGLVVGFDDEPGTTAALDRLSRDESLRNRMRGGALAAAERWPTVEAASATFAAAVREIAASDPPELDVALRRLAHGRRRAIEVQREALRRGDVTLRGVRGAVAWWQDAHANVSAQLAERGAALDDCSAKVAEYGAWTSELEARIAALQERPAFRAEERLRRLVRRTP